MVKDGIVTVTGLVVQPLQGTNGVKLVPFIIHAKV